MVVVSEWQVVIDDKFYEMGPYEPSNHVFGLIRTSMGKDGF